MSIKCCWKEEEVFFYVRAVWQNIFEPNGEEMCRSLMPRWIFQYVYMSVWNRNRMCCSLFVARTLENPAFLQVSRIPKPPMMMDKFSMRRCCSGILTTLLGMEQEVVLFPVCQKDTAESRLSVFRQCQIPPWWGISIQLSDIVPGWSWISEA